MYKFAYSFLFVCFISILFSSYQTSKRTGGIENLTVPNENIYWVSSLDSISEISINIVGDLMCHLRQINNARLSDSVYDFNPTFEYIKPYLQGADITIGNLETTFAGTSQPYVAYPIFNSPDAFCTAIKNAGFSFLVTANNHSMDTQEAGLIRTIEILKQNHLGYTGTYKDQHDHDSIRILNIKGINLGILNYTYGTNGAYPVPEHKFMLNVIDSADIVTTVNTAKNKGADIVVVVFHMGLENVTEPTQLQKDAVRFALVAGATIVIGSHPHMIGPTKKVYSEAIKDTAFIAYSLGNFLSNQYWRYTDAGVILKLIIQKNYTRHTTIVKESTFLPTWVYRGDGTKKVHIIFPAQWGIDGKNLPDFITSSQKQKMVEAFNDTKSMLSKDNPGLKLNLVK